MKMNRIWIAISLCVCLICLGFTSLEGRRRVYYPDASVADQGAATGRSVKNLVDSIGTSAEVTMVFAHSGSGNTTTYTFTTAEVIPANITLIVENGVLIDGSVTISSPENIEVGYKQQIFASTATITFTEPGIISAMWFGAVADGSTEDSTGLYNALSAVPEYGTFYLPDTGSAYILDRELYVTVSMKIKGDKYSTIKLKNSSSLFNDTANTYGRYLLHIRSSNVLVEGIEFNGNSQNNYYESGGIKYYYTLTPIRSVHCCVTGFYGAGVSYANISNIKFINCWVHDFTGGGLSTYNDSTHTVYNYSVTDSFFERIHGVAVALNYAENCKIENNSFNNTYMYAFQYYYSTFNSTFSGNVIRLNESEIDSNDVDPKEYSVDGYLSNASAISVGKTNLLCSRGNTVSNNVLNGGWIKITDGTEYTTINNNIITNAYRAGISCQIDYITLGDATTQYDVTNPSGNIFRYAYDGTGTDPAITANNPPIGARIYFYGGTFSYKNSGFQTIVASGTNYFEVSNANGLAETNKVSTIRWEYCRGIEILDNIIYNSGGPGMYLSDTYDWINVKNNIVHGSCSISDTYGALTAAANIFIVSPFYRIIGNTCRRIGENPDYGIHYYTGVLRRYRVDGSEEQMDVYHIQDNNIYDSGTVADFYDIDNSAHGNLNTRKYMESSIADDGLIYLPDASSGMVFVSITDPSTTFTDESGFWMWRSDGVVTKIVGTANTDSADTDGKLCVYDYGTYPVIRNRMGNVGIIRVVYFY